MIHDSIQFAIDQERIAVERALKSWIDQSGMTAEEWGKVYSYRVERRWEGFTLHTRVVPVLLSEPQYSFEDTRHERAF